MEDFISFRKRISYISMGVFFLVTFLFFSSYASLKKYKKTIHKLWTIEYLLNDEKEDSGEYPHDISFLANHREYKNLCFDSWKNLFYYERTNDGQDFLLISKGKDGLLFTKDDIKNSDL